MLDSAGMEMDAGPRATIPDGWAEKGVCPFCARKSMVVVRATGLPDRLRCGSCGGSFEVELGGPRIRIRSLPGNFPSDADVLMEKWLTFDQIKVVLEALPPLESSALPVPSIQNMPNERTVSTFSKSIENVEEDSTSLPINPPGVELDEENYSFYKTDSLDQQDINNRALELARLGNNQAIILKTLARSGATKEQIQTAIDSLRIELERDKQDRRKSPTVYILASVLILTALLIAAFFLFVFPRLSQRVTQISNTPLDLTGRQATPTLVPLNQPLTGTLPEDSEVYFRVLWTMSGSFTQKSEVLRSLAIPAGLEDIHQIAITEFSSAGAVEDTLTACKARLTSAGCSSETGETSAECQVLQSECITDEVAYADAVNQLKQVWLGTICPVYESYYAVYLVQFPYPKGQCRLP